MQPLLPLIPLDLESLLPDPRFDPRLTLENPLRDALVRKLQQLAEVKTEDITLAEFREAAGVGYRLIVRQFGRWGDLRKAAGLPPHGKRRGWGGAYTDEQILEALKQLVAEQGEYITAVEFTRVTGISQKAVTGHFASFAELRRRAGLKPEQRRPPQFSDDELLAEYHRVAIRLDRIPTGDEFDRLARISMATLHRRIGGKRQIARKYAGYLRRLNSKRQR